MVALSWYFVASSLPLLPGRLLQQTDAVHAAILLLLMRRLLLQANALHQAILLLLVRRLLLQATPSRIPLLHAARINLRTLRLLFKERPLMVFFGPALVDVTFFYCSVVGV